MGVVIAGIVVVLLAGVLTPPLTTATNSPLPPATVTLRPTPHALPRCWWDGDWGPCEVKLVPVVLGGGGGSAPWLTPIPDVE